MIEKGKEFFKNKTNMSKIIERIGNIFTIVGKLGSGRVRVIFPMVGKIGSGRGAFFQWLAKSSPGGGIFQWLEKSPGCVGGNLPMVGK